MPVIVAITQFLKKTFPGKFKRKSELLSLIVSVIVCAGWWLYTTPEMEIIAYYQGGLVSGIKGFIDLLIVSFATWLSSSKSYDFFLGEKKRNREIDEQLVEKQNLLNELQVVKSGRQESRGYQISNQNMEYMEVSKKLRDILEGRY